MNFATLLDIGLPELDGFEVAKRIRQEPLRHGTVLITVTGHRPGGRPAAYAGGGIRSLPGQVRRFREITSILDGGHGEGDGASTERVE